MTSLNPTNIKGVVRRTFQQAPLDAPGELMAQIVRQALAMGERDLLNDVVRAVVDSQRKDAPWQLPSLATVLDALERRSIDMESLPAETRSRISRLIDVAGQVALDEKLPLAQRVEATRLLRSDAGDPKQNRDNLAELIERS